MTDTTVKLCVDHALEETSDNDLLLAIGLHGDHGAFDELYRRYRQQAYSTARFLTSSTQAAEEAFQNGMLRVWRYAKSYKPDGNARGWILRTVAREGLKQNRLGLGEMRGTSMEKIQEPMHVATSEDLDPEHQERLSALRKCLESMNPSLRQMVLLYYMANLTHKEIGRELNLPTRTVCYKLEHALKRMRRNLTEAGLASTLPLLSGTQIGRDLAAAHSAKPGLFENVQSMLAQQPQAILASEGSLRAVPGINTKVLLIPAILASTAAGIVWLLLATNFAPPTPKGNVPISPAMSNQLAGDAVNVSSDSFDLTWTFENGKPNNLKVTQGKWRPTGNVQMKSGRIAISSGQPGMLSGTDLTTIIHLPVAISESPVRIDLSLFHQDSSISSHWAAFPSKGEYPMPSEAWARNFNYTKMSIQGTIFVFSRYVVKIANGEVQAVRVARDKTSECEILLAFQNTAVSRIRVRTIRLDDLPPEYRQPEDLIKALKLVHSVAVNATDFEISTEH